MQSFESTVGMTLSRSCAFTLLRNYALTLLIRYYALAYPFDAFLTPKIVFSLIAEAPPLSVIKKVKPFLHTLTKCVSFKCVSVQVFWFCFVKHFFLSNLLGSRKYFGVSHAAVFCCADESVLSC